MRLLFGLLLILVLTSEVWRYAGRLEGVRLTILISCALGLAGILVGVGLRRTLPAALPRTVASRAALRVAAEAAIFGVLLSLLFSGLGFFTVVTGWSRRERCRSKRARTRLAAVGDESQGSSRRRLHPGGRLHPGVSGA